MLNVMFLGGWVKKFDTIILKFMKKYKILSLTQII